nr:unnamed protein product [Callosobruchus analis]
MKTLCSNFIQISVIRKVSNTNYQLCRSPKSIFRRGSYRKYPNSEILKTYQILFVFCASAMYLATSKVCMSMPRHVEDLLRNIASHFNRSPARRRKFEQFQEFFQVKIHKILSLSTP